MVTTQTQFCLSLMQSDIKTECGAGEIAQWVSGLLYRHGDLSSDPLNSSKRVVVVHLQSQNSCGEMGS